MTFDVTRNDHPLQDETRIVPFRPRTSATAPGHVVPEPASPPENQTDDFRHRMWANLAGLACAALLVASGIWLAVRMADVRQTQDCVLSGRRNCAPIATGDRQATSLRQH